MEQEEINKLPHKEIDKCIEEEFQCFKQRCTVGLLTDAEYMRLFLKRLSLKVYDIIREDKKIVS